MDPTQLQTGSWYSFTLKGQPAFKGEVLGVDGDIVTVRTEGGQQQTFRADDVAQWAIIVTEGQEQLRT